MLFLFLFSFYYLKFYCISCETHEHNICVMLMWVFAMLKKKRNHWMLQVTYFVCNWIVVGKITLKTVHFFFCHKEKKSQMWLPIYVAHHQTYKKKRRLIKLYIQFLRHFPHSNFVIQRYVREKRNKSQVGLKRC